MSDRSCKLQQVDPCQIPMISPQPPRDTGDVAPQKEAIVQGIQLFRVLSERPSGTQQPVIFWDGIPSGYVKIAIENGP